MALLGALALAGIRVPTAAYASNPAPLQKIGRDAAAFESALTLLSEARDLPVNGPADAQRMIALIDRALPVLRSNTVAGLAQAASTDPSFTAGLDAAMAKTAPADLIKQLAANPAAVRGISGFSSAQGRADGKAREINALYQAVARKINTLKKGTPVARAGDAAAQTFRALTQAFVPTLHAQVEGAIAFVAVVVFASAYIAAKAHDFIPEPQNNNATPFVQCMDRCQTTGAACLNAAGSDFFKQLECRGAVLTCTGGCMFLVH